MVWTSRHTGAPVKETARREAIVVIVLREFLRSSRNSIRNPRVSVNPVTTNNDLFTNASRGDINSSPQVNMAAPKAIQPPHCRIQKSWSLPTRLLRAENDKELSGSCWRTVELRELV